MRCSGARLSAPQPGQNAKSGRIGFLHSTQWTSVILGFDDQYHLFELDLRRYFFVMLLALFASLSLAFPSADPTEAAITQFGNELLNTKNTVGFAVGVIENGHEYRRYFGSVRRGSNQAPDGKTLFQLGSITKTFTAALLSHAVKEGVANLDDPLAKYLPGVAMPISNTPITLLDLADHSSGLQRTPNTKGRTSTSYEQMNDELRSLRLKFEPGSGYLYSNLAFGLLSEALMNAYHARTWAEVMEKEVTRPIGMQDTTPFITPGLQSRVPLWYDKAGVETAWRNPAFPAVNGAGALYSDLDDMMKYLAYMLRGAKDDDPIVSFMLQPHNPMKTPGQSVGLAWQVLKMPNGKTVVDKDGALKGSVAYIAFVKGANIGFVFLSNARFPCVPPCRKFLAKLEKLPDLGGGEEEEGGE